MTQPKQVGGGFNSTVVGARVVFSIFLGKIFGLGRAETFPRPKEILSNLVTSAFEAASRAEALSVAVG